MAASSTPKYRFGDLLALARQSWITQMAAELADGGYPDYRRSDAAAVRLLGRGPMPVGRLGDALGVTRQAARKVVTGLERRGFAAVHRDPRDARQLNVALTADGHAYARAVTAVIDHLNRALVRRVTPDQLAAADTVLRAVLADEHTRTLASYLPPPHEPTGTPD
jgi:DNA-binding MarR family transcriptional regulator